jgi:hypothetical protein
MEYLTDNPFFENQKPEKPTKSGYSGFTLFLMLLVGAAIGVATYHFREAIKAFLDKKLTPPKPISDVLMAFDKATKTKAKAGFKEEDELDDEEDDNEETPLLIGKGTSAKKVAFVWVISYKKIDTEMGFINDQLIEAGYEVYFRFTNNNLTKLKPYPDLVPDLFIGFINAKKLSATILDSLKINIDKSHQMILVNNDFILPDDLMYHNDICHFDDITDTDFIQNKIFDLLERVKDVKY